MGDELKNKMRTQNSRTRRGGRLSGPKQPLRKISSETPEVVCSEPQVEAKTRPEAEDRLNGYHKAVRSPDSRPHPDRGLTPWTRSQAGSPPGLWVPDSHRPNAETPPTPLLLISYKDNFDKNKNLKNLLKRKETTSTVPLWVVFFFFFNLLDISAPLRFSLEREKKAKQDSGAPGGMLQTVESSPREGVSGGG